MSTECERCSSAPGGLLEHYEQLEKQLVAINTAFHDLLRDFAARGEITSLLVHPNSTVRLTAKSYCREDE